MELRHFSNGETPGSHKILSDRKEIVFLVQVFNHKALPEFDGQTEQAEYMAENPFDGIEVVGLAGTEKEAFRLMDAHKKRCEISFKYHIEEIGK